MISLRIGTDRLVEAERSPLRVAPIERGHPPVVGRHDPGVGPVICRQLKYAGSWKPIRELEDIADGRSAKAVEALVLVADDAQIPGDRGQIRNDALLDK